MDQPLDLEIAHLIQDAGIATLNTDLFLGSLPENVTEGLTIITVPSPAPHKYVDTEDQVFDFKYTSPNDDTARTKLRQIYNLFHRKANYATNNFYIYFSNSLGQIRDNDRNQEGGKMLVLSIQYKYRNLNNVS